MEMLGLLPDRQDAVSFCVVRNPYDRALSSVMHFSTASWVDAEEESARKQEFERDLEIWLNSPLSDHNRRAHRRPQMDFLRDKRGEIAVDYILRFERLQQDFAAMAAQLGRADSGFAKVGASGRRRNYLDFYTPRSRQLIEEAYGDDIEELKYGFSDLRGDEC